jgi:retinol dehydrogenase-12
MDIIPNRMTGILTLLARWLHSQLLFKIPLPTRDFSGQTIIVTGSNTGMGLEAARHFVRLGAGTVILAVRNASKGTDAKQSIESSTGRLGVVEVWDLDLTSYASVKAFAARASRLVRLDAVVENAGLTTNRFSMAEDNELLITVHVVSTFLLAFLLLPKLRETSLACNKDVTLTLVGSLTHWIAQFKERRSSSIFEACADPEKTNMSDR